MKAVFFDLDGTLIDSRADLATAVNLTRADFLLPPLSQEVVAGFVGEGLRKLLERSIPEMPAAMDELLAHARTHYRAHWLDRTTLYPGTTEVLRELKSRGWKRAVVTNKPSEYVQPILAGLGVADWFDALVGGGDTKLLKPDPAPIHLAAERMGLSDLRGSWMVGDHFTDLAAGRNAGLLRCFCRFGFGDARDEKYDLAIDSFAELVDGMGKVLGS
jgi:phosphoglycolate phosphatase